MRQSEQPRLRPVKDAMCHTRLPQIRVPFCHPPAGTWQVPQAEEALLEPARLAVWTGEHTVHSMATAACCAWPERLRLRKGLEIVLQATRRAQVLAAGLGRKPASELRAHVQPWHVRDISENLQGCTCGLPG